jgi:hypothetical protein
LTKDEALKLALEALEIYDKSHDWISEGRDAIAAIKEALAQPAQRPWVGLTDDEIDKKYWAMPRIDKPQPTQFEFARAIEQLLKEKNFD